jgi:hypothetical protein
MLLLLAAISLMEMFLIYIFRLIQLGLITTLVSLGGAELICWLWSDIEEELEEEKSTVEEKDKSRRDD